MSTGTFNLHDNGYTKNSLTNGNFNLEKANPSEDINEWSAAIQQSPVARQINSLENGEEVFYQYTISHEKNLLAMADHEAPTLNEQEKAARVLYIMTVNNLQFLNISEGQILKIPMRYPSIREIIFRNDVKAHRLKMLDPYS